MDKPTKITFAELRELGVRGVLIYCADYQCSHSIAVMADQWADDLRLSDIEHRFKARPGLRANPPRGRTNVRHQAGEDDMKALR